MLLSRKKDLPNFDYYPSLTLFLFNSLLSVLPIPSDGL